MEMKFLVEANKASKKFQVGTSAINALTDVTLRIAPGGMIALMGPSGSGKSSLLNLFGALDRPTSGQIFFMESDLAELNPDQRAQFRNRSIGFIFQNFNLIPILTAFENVLLPHQLGGEGSESDAKARASFLLERVGLAQQAGQSVNQLSGGQMQRVGVARALMNKPRLVLADEPTANLDRASAENVLRILQDLCISEGATVVVATHDHGVLSYCSRIVSMRDGKILTDEITSRS